MTRVWIVIIALCAAARADGVPKHLVIGTKPSPPFSIKNADGTWSGISIDLWKSIAADLGTTYEIVELDLPGLLAAVQHKTIDVGVASTTITAEREAVMDFTHPIYSTGLSIATKPGGRGGMVAVVCELAGRVVVLPNAFERQDYGFALPDGSPLRQPINRALLEELGRDDWRALLARYLGP